MTQTIFITGASSGFGKAAATLFAEKGWNVAATMRTPKGDFAAFDNVLELPLDVTRADTISSAVNAVVSRFGTIDVLLNNAGFAVNGLFEASTDEEIFRQFDTNVFGLMRVTRAFLPVMRKAGQGMILNLSSMGGVITLPMLSLYHASKFAVEGFTESLSYELTSQNIQVKLIEPGSATTNFAGRSMTVSDASGLTDYDAFVKNYTETRESYLSAERSSADDIAKAIYTAATDGKAQLRYVVGADAQAHIDYRQKNGADRFVKKIKEDFNITKA